MSSFELAIGTVLENEGGLVDNKDDPGGLTKFGISKKSYPNLDIKNLTRDEAIAIYKRDFWMFDGVNDQRVGTKIFDFYVNEKHDGIKVLQRVLHLDADGVWGPNTLTATNAAIPDLLLQNYRDALCQHYQDIVDANPSEEKFLAGWLIRAKQ